MHGTKDDDCSHLPLFVLPDTKVGVLPSSHLNIYVVNRRSRHNLPIHSVLQYEELGGHKQSRRNELTYLKRSIARKTSFMDGGPDRHYALR